MLAADDWRLKRYRGRWYAVRPGPAGTERRALRTGDRDQAARAFRDFCAALSRPAADASVATLFAAYLADRPNARAADAWKRLAPHFGHLTPDHVDRPTCRTYATARRTAGAGDGTIIRELTVLRAALRFNNKATPAVIEVPERPPPRERHLDRPEYIRLRAAARPIPHLYLFVVLALATGARKEALLDLKWTSIDWSRRQANLGKGTAIKRRGIKPLRPRPLAALRRAQQAATSDYVIEYAGGRVHSIRTAWANACTRAGLGEDVTPHTLRHTAGVWMAEAGIPMSEISQYLDHSSTKVTERVYARYGPEYQRRAAAALG